MLSILIKLKRNIMIAQAQGVLSKSIGAVSSSGSSIKALAGSHPVALGAVIGIGIYYAVNKYWLNKDEDEAIEMTEKAEESDKGAATA